jgi:hypothetical protein
MLMETRPQVKKKALSILFAVIVLWFVITQVGIKLTFIGDRVIPPAVGSGFCGIRSLGGRALNGNLSGNVLLPGVDGSFIGHPCTGKQQLYTTPYTIISHSLVYWSAADRSLCQARLGEKSRWYKVAKWLPAGTDVCAVCASKTKIYLDIYDKNGPVTVIKLDPVTGIVTAVPNAVEVRAHENCDSIAVLQPGGFVQFRDPHDKQIGALMKSGAINFWDADASTGFVCSQHSSYLTLFEKGKRKIIAVGDRQYTGLSLCPGKDVIWMADIYSVIYPLFSIWYGQINVYNYSGTYLGQKIVCNGPAYAPMYLSDPTIKAITTKLDKDARAVLRAGGSNLTL